MQHTDAERIVKLETQIEALTGNLEDMNLVVRGLTDQLNELSRTIASNRGAIVAALAVVAGATTVIGGIAAFFFWISDKIGR